MALKYRQLGRTGVKVSELCFGTMNFADGTEDDEAERILSKFCEAGGNFVDTADIYAGGKSEEMLGRILKKLGNRDNVFLATKGHNRTDAGPNDFGNSRLHLIRACEQSLKRLQVEYIDLYQIHRPQPDIPIDETLGALDQLAQSGKILYAGCSNFPAWSIVDSLWASTQHHLVRFVSEQPPYNLLDRRVERELLPMASTYGVAVLPWGPLAGGMLSGKYKRNSSAPEGSRYDINQYRGAPISEAVWRILESLEELAVHKGISLSQLSLAWLLSRPAITSPIIGARTLEQLEDNLQAVDVKIAPDEDALIDEIIPPGTFVKSYYELNQTPAVRW